MTRQDSIDAHVHLWAGKASPFPRAPGEPDYPPDEFSPERYLALAEPNGVSRAVAVQMSFYGRDHAFLLDAVRRFPGRFAPVGLLVDDPAAEMDALGGKGLRAFRVVAGRFAPETLGRAWQAAARSGAVLCALVNPKELPLLDRLCAECPAAPVVVDHLARIGMDGEMREDDVGRLCGLARHPNVAVKVSAFYALGLRRPPYADLAPLVERIWRAFGAERLMWGSDAPFQFEPPHDCGASLDLIREGLPFLGPAGREWLESRTAARVFFGEE